MKTYLKYFLVLTLFLPVIGHAQHKDLDKLLQPERDSILIAIAKETILEWGPDWYEHCNTTVITRRIFPTGISARSDDAGRIEYRVTFPWDKSHNRSADVFVVRVSIWEDNGRAHGIMFGNGLGRGGFDRRPLTRSGEKPQHSIVPGPKPAIKP